MSANLAAMPAPMRRRIYSPATRQCLARVRRRWRTEGRCTPLEWPERYRKLSAEGSAFPGDFRFERTPYLRGILEAYADPAVTDIWCQKSAQVGWTDGVINNVVGYHIDQDPCPILILFSKDGAGKAYCREKLEPMIRATPRLSARINLKSRASTNTLDHKSFPGGFIKLVGSNSPASVKSTPIKVAIVEEPDDTSDDVRGQGDSIALADERTKTYHGSKRLVGGTPTVKGLSKIEAGMLGSDQRRFFVPCHHCGEANPLSWGNVTWKETDEQTAPDPVFGHDLPETAVYVCPACGCTWNNDEKNANVARAEAAGYGWRATAPFRGCAGFYFNELYSSFPKSTLAHLAIKFLKAVDQQRKGNVGPMIAFVNSTLGEPWELKGETPELELLKDRGEDYGLWCAPAGALVLTAGIDVQHDRIAVCIYAWGRGEECWLVDWQEINGAVITNLPTEGVWVQASALMDRLCTVPGGSLPIRAISIDASDGKTADNVYAWVRHEKRRRPQRISMAIKGSNQAGREIYSPPRDKIDITQTGKAAKWGLTLYSVGTDRAKDLLIGRDGRLSRSGHGPGCMHWPKSARDDYLVQLTAEVKAPKAGSRKLVWQCKSGVRNEALDCTVYALHAARRLRVNALTESEWQRLEASLRQSDLLAPVAPTPVVAEPVTTPATPKPQAPAARPGGSFLWSSQR